MCLFYGVYPQELVVIHRDNAILAGTDGEKSARQAETSREASQSQSSEGSGGAVRFAEGEAS